MRASARLVLNGDQCQDSPEVSTSGSTPGPPPRTCLHGDSACAGSGLSLHPLGRVCSCPGVLQSGNGTLAQRGLSPQAGLRAVGNALQRLPTTKAKDMFRDTEGRVTFPLT